MGSRQEVVIIGLGLSLTFSFVACSTSNSSAGVGGATESSNIAVNAGGSAGASVAAAGASAAGSGGTIAATGGQGGDVETKAGQGGGGTGLGTSGSAKNGSGGGGKSGVGGSGGSGGKGGTGGSAPVTCTGQGLQPGDSTTPITFSRLSRNYILHVPTGYKHTQPIPLVLNIHAYSSDAPYQKTSSNMNATADANGFAVAYPNSDSNSWNAGACCGASRDSNNDDIQFIRDVVTDIKAKICVDPSRIYVAGMSNGGFLSNYLGCKASDLFAAIAPVSGMLGITDEECKPSRPVPVYYVHGDADPVVPFNGGSWLLGPDLMSADESTAGWVARNHCKDAQPDVTNKVGNTTCSTYHECDKGVEVTFCTVAGGGHCWPGMEPPCQWFGGLQPGGTIPDLKGSDEIWKFFSKYTL